MKKEYKLAKLLNDELSEDEIAQMKTASDFAIYDKIKQYSGELETPLSENPRMLENVLSAKNQPKTISLQQPVIWISAAASLALIVGMTLWLTMIGTVSARTGYAQTKEIALPDGSLVTLNSEATVNFNERKWENDRKLSLEGEAYFKVAKGKKFSVLTKNGTVTVLGTQFNVRSRETKIEVSCYEGRVLVAQNGIERILTPGESVWISKGEWHDLETASKKPQWLEARIAFNAASLHEIMSELQRTYDIRIDSKFQVQKTFTGVLPANDLETALKIIESTFGMKRIQRAQNKYELKPE